jgi:hypothetical protein
MEKRTVRFSCSCNDEDDFIKRNTFNDEMFFVNKVAEELRQIYSLLEEIDYTPYMMFKEKVGEYYTLRLPIGVTPPEVNSKIRLNGIDVVVFSVSTPDDIAKGRGGTVARNMRENGIAYSVNCLPEGHEYLRR